MSYVLRDVVAVLGLATVATRIDSWLLCSAVQGTMFWALIMLVHDWCSSPQPMLNPRTSFILEPLRSYKKQEQLE
ncbi:hypothetical protein E2562_020399 [Oryza meyeriana var. granulata]|uniref:Uncharacterized protein n=1 Tax=Oryza meyeriana var. granulata TaxID=110450 RepID=A0A6G1DK88_9ORYZ|nr:hypothetical protein E2562_020399 [Oryza meyeriana var. granulata]